MTRFELEMGFTNDPELRQAYRAYTSGLLPAVHQMLNQLLSRDQENGRYWELLGLVRHAWKQWKWGVDALEEASVLIPLSGAGECALADCYRAEGRTEWARSLYSGILIRKDATPQALRGAAVGLDVMSEPLMSVAACRRAIKLDPEVAQPYFELSYYLRRCGAPFPTVEAAARQAIHLDPDNFEFRIGLAVQLNSHGRLTAAWKLLERATLNHVKSLRCPCCLTRLTAFFEAMADNERVQWCYQQQESLSLTKDEADC